MVWNPDAAWVQSFLGFGPSATVEIKFKAPVDEHKTEESAAVAKKPTARPTRRVETMDGSSTEELVIFSGKEHVRGVVNVIVPAGKKLEHTGIKLELMGSIGE